MKGQTFMPDFMASILVFAIILTVFLGSWNSVISSQGSDISEDIQVLQASHTTSFLVSTPGYPEDWEDDSVKVEIIGFASPDHVLQESKLEAFRDLSEDKQKSLLQTDEFYMSIENDTGIISMNGGALEFGSSYSDAENIMPVTRNVQLNKSGKIFEAQLKYVVWE